MRFITQPFEFIWDSGNKDKNLIQHKVTNEECEETFFDPHKKWLKDQLHSHTEARYILLGKSTNGRVLFIVFTMRGEKIRIISARDLNKREAHLYE